MNDVLGQILLTAGNVYFRPRDRVAAVIQRLSLGFDQAQIGPALGFGQTHGTSPLPIAHFRQVDFLELVTRTGVDGIKGPDSQTGIRAHAGVCAGNHFFNGKLQTVWQTLTAPLGRLAHAGKTHVTETLVGLFESIRRPHHPVFVTAPLTVTRFIEW